MFSQQPPIQGSKADHRKREFLKKNDDIDEDALTGSAKSRKSASDTHIKASSAQKENRTKWAEAVMSSKTIKVLSKEFANNKKYKPTGYTTAAYDKNEPKNRYNDIICIDATRVVLKERPPEDDYIHASWMTMPDQFKFICTQGPLLETLEDFWHMMVTEKSNVLVQLCNFVEGKHEKCREYFPKSKGSTESYGPHKVTFKDTKPDPFESVKYSILEVESKGNTMTVHHFAYLVWPDHTAPFDPAPIIGCLKMCRQLAGSQPITVHCSAGIGRSATFVAMEYAWQKIRLNGDTQMVDVMKELRAQRFHAIQSPIQYIFLHMCVLELAAEENLVDRKQKMTPYLDSYVRMLKKYNKKVKAAEEKATTRD